LTSLGTARYPSDQSGDVGAFREGVAGAGPVDFRGDAMAMDERRLQFRGPACLALGLLLGLVVAALCPRPAAAVVLPPELLWQSPADLTTGSGAGELRDPRGIATSPVSGDVYIADRGNYRISEFTPWGEFVKAWGWGVRNGAAEFQTCGPGAAPPSGTCLQGLDGVGSGQIHSAVGLAVDSAGGVYVSETEECVGGTGCGQIQNFRVQKFDPDGNFVLMFGGEVNKTKTAEIGSTEAERNVCTAASGNTCGIGILGSGAGQFSDRSDRDLIAAGPDGTIFVGDTGRLQEFTPDGAFGGQVSGELASETVRSLDVDADGNFYLTLSSTFRHSKDNVRKLDPTGASVQEFPLIEPAGVTIAADGTVFAIEKPGQEVGALFRIVAFAADGVRIVPTIVEIEANEARVKEGKLPHWFGEVSTTQGFLFGLTASSACGIDGSDIYVSSDYPSAGKSYVTGYGPPPDPDLCPPPPVPPTIGEQLASSVEPEAATIKARINPHFWSDVTFYVEYGTGKCSEGGCPNVEPATEAEFGKRVVDAAVLSPGIELSGLSPETTYHFRVVAKSSGGGPVVGVGPGNAEETFRTPALPPGPSPDTCANAAFRVGLSALLQDCRAYEMVSPVDKKGGDVVNLVEILNEPADINQSAADGERLTYSTYRAFGDAQSAPYTSQYLASRDPESGWENHGISPPRNGSQLGNIGLDAEYRGFSSDLCHSWLLHDSDPPLAPGAIAEYANLYSTNICAEGEPEYVAATTVTPECSVPKSYAPIPQGFSSNPDQIVFQVQDRLTNNAAPCIDAGNQRPFQCYNSDAGKLRLVSVLPNGAANKGSCSIGATFQPGPLRYSNVAHAVSTDGSRVFWTATSFGAAAGTIYLRVNPGQPPSKLVEGECTEATKACTIDVSGPASSSPALYWAASSDGAKVIFSTGDYEKGQADLYEATIEEQTGHLVATPTLIATDVWGVMGVSDDASRIYLASGEALDGDSSVGNANLYFYEVGSGGSSFDFIATLPALDTTPSGNSILFVSPFNPNPTLHASRVAPDGLHASFMSRGVLTGYNNTDPETGEAATEIFSYDAAADAGDGRLTCVSCNPTGARPAAHEMLVKARESGIWVAAKLPGVESQYYYGRALIDDGSRLYFESYDPLNLRDTNSKKDVYQWEAPGKGDCVETDATFSQSAGGCVSLISSGRGEQDARFVDASSDGNDVFFATATSLVAQDPALIDIYDARVGGGFAPPPAPRPACAGESCAGPALAPPADPAPPSLDSGPGNLAPKPRCPKGKHRVTKKGKTRCVRTHKKRKHQKRRDHGQRRAGR
jgi:DNA-binding beta-propeller fold protein YncE